MIILQRLNLSAVIRTFTATAAVDIICSVIASVASFNTPGNLLLIDMSAQLIIVTFSSMFIH